jgi:hypothetical protein
MSKSIPQNPRKLKRYLENEYYAQSARFWMGAVKTVDRMTEFRYPINKQTRNSVSYSTKSPMKRRNKKRNKKWEEIEEERKTIVYAVKFDDTKGIYPTFIKVGITGGTIEERFLADLERYEFSLIKSKLLYTRKAALVLEGSIHTLLTKHSFRPEKILLSGGNSECFVYSAELEKMIENLLT